MGRRTTFFDKRGIKTTYQHDKLGRVTLADFNATNVSPYEHRVVTFTYDAGDRVTSMVDQVWSGLSLLFYQTLTYTYDGMDNVTSEIFVNLLTPGTNGTAMYALDANGRRTAMTTSGSGQSGNRTASYTYYNDDQLQTITDPNASVLFVPDAAGRRGTLTTNSVTTTYGYDNASRLTSLTYTKNGNTLGDLTYTYDQDSRVTRVRQLRAQQPARNRDRHLFQHQPGQQVEHYVFDRRQGGQPYEGPSDQQNLHLGLAQPAQAGEQSADHFYVRRQCAALCAELGLDDLELLSR
jgi:hypothetical protein